MWEGCVVDKTGKMNSVAEMDIVVPITEEVWYFV